LENGEMDFTAPEKADSARLPMIELILQ
jgi:hypothetical protein